MLLNEVTAYLFKAHSLKVHGDGISYLRSGVLHLGDGIGIRELPLAVLAVVVLRVLVCAEFDDVF